MCNDKKCKFRAAYEDAQDRLCRITDAVTELLASEDPAEFAVASQLMNELGLNPDTELTI